MQLVHDYDNNNFISNPPSNYTSSPLKYKGPLPKAIYPYFDKIQAKVKYPLSREEASWLKKQCEGKVHIEPCYKSPYAQYIRIYQPSSFVIAWLATREDVLVNALEWSLDWVFKTQEELDDATNFARKYFVKKHHRDQGIRDYEATRYTGPRGAPNVIAIYGDKPCRITGDKFCLHFDWRMNGVNTLRRAKINSVADLLRPDHREFWSKRLIFGAFDHEWLGRLHNNYFKGSRRQHSWEWVRYLDATTAYVYSIDRRRGAMIVRILGSTQAVLDEYRGELKLWSIMDRYNVTDLLPEPLTLL